MRMYRLLDKLKFKVIHFSLFIVILMILALSILENELEDGYFNFVSVLRLGLIIVCVFLVPYHIKRLIAWNRSKYED